MDVGTVVVEKFRGAAVVRLIGAFSLRATEEIEGALQPLHKAGPMSVIVDLEEATSLDSAVIGTLIGWSSRLMSAGGQLLICAPSEPVADAFRILRVGEFIPIYSDRVAALLATPKVVQQALKVKDRRKAQKPFEGEDRRNA